MRPQVGRRALGAFVLAATLLLAAPAGALAAGPRPATDGEGWGLIWQRLAEAWDGMRDAMAGLVPTWERDTVAPKPGFPPPPPSPGPPPPRDDDDDPFDDGDTGTGLDPNG